MTPRWAGNQQEKKKQFLIESTNLHHICIMPAIRRKRAKRQKLNIERTPELGRSCAGSTASSARRAARQAAQLAAGAASPEPMQ